MEHPVLRTESRITKSTGRVNWIKFDSESSISLPLSNQSNKEFMACERVLDCVVQPASKVHGCKVFSGARPIFALPKSKFAMLGYKVNPLVSSTFFGHIHLSHNFNCTFTVCAGSFSELSDWLPKSSSQYRQARPQIHATWPLLPSTTLYCCCRWTSTGAAARSGVRGRRPRTASACWTATTSSTSPSRTPTARTTSRKSSLSTASGKCWLVPAWRPIYWRTWVGLTLILALPPREKSTFDSMISLIPV